MIAKHTLAALATLTLCGTAAAQANDSWRLGAVLDAAYTTRALELGGRDKGLQLGHSDLTASGPLGRWARAQFTLVLATHEGKLERELEEAWVDSTALPAGLQLRAGRFASQIGYLNQQHPHADDFVERPLLYRGLFGGHWSDDGLRLNWTAPTPFYLMLGVEALRGKRLVEETAAAAPRVGASTWVIKAGDDIGRSHSWQLGLSYIHNRREAALEDHGAEPLLEAAAEHAHEHAHGAQFSGRKTWLVDATWKWAPGGNNREQQLRLNVEAARTTGLNRYATSQDQHQAESVSLVWRFQSEWELGARTDWLRASMPHGDHFHGARLREHALMLAWKPSHMQTVRLQYSTQRGAVEFENPAKRSLQLQYILAFGAHGSHAF
ncbi:hypothetical protein ACG0Z6_00070 [Roseateles sp. BYS180W]|uniref:Porin n=1 Tax=Roseateles rivi TaxID=3299028 RepID=A0ABW7FQN6_9BURK